MSKVKANKEKTSKRIVKEETTFVGQGNDGPTPVKLVQEVERYTFRNIGKSMFFVTAPYSKITKKLAPGETRDDFTAKERDRILSSYLYKAGQIVEELYDDIDKSASPNSLSDKQLDTLLMLDNDEIKEYILKMDSPFALKRVREGILDRGLPAHLISYIDSREKELQEKYEEENLAPVDAMNERSI